MAKKLIKSIVIFEDDKRERQRLEKVFKEEFKSTRVNVYPFKPINKPVKEPFEDRLKKDLDKANLGEICLFVTDRDLSKTEDYIGFSEAAVSKVADKHIIPMCLYARGVTSDELKKRQRWSDFKIIMDIDEGPKKIAQESKAIFEGFQQIMSKCESINKKSGKKPNSPAEILAMILNKPHLKDRIALYGAGDQQMLVDILPYYKENVPRKDHRIKDIQSRIPRLLGYWLWDSILRFPGIVVNEKAAASYLNIGVNDFKEKKIRKLFDSAVYEGPFEGIRLLWWRDELDNILAEENCNDGLTLTKKKGIKNVKDCRCSVDKTKKAGYYCMVTKEPVSAENSRSNISWFPAGADLARISKTVFDELAPWLGLY